MDEFRQRIDQAFDVYLDVAKPVGAKRIALRYINRIVMSANQEIELGEYFKVYPQIPEGMPETISGFLTRAESIYKDLPIKLVLTLSDAIAPPGQADFILDLEISQDWAEKPLPLQEVLSNLDELKQRQGQAFENLITDRARELFDVK